MLRDYLTSLPEKEKKVVFFDEMPWMDTARSGFLNAFEYFWNSFGASLDNLVFIVCGSASSWLAEHIDRNKGGLFNRLTCRLYLEPFSLHETELYLRSMGIEWSRYDIAECYMVMGGIPYYLSLLRNDLSCPANIDHIFFRKRAELWDEFSHLYHTLFSNGDKYIRIVEALSERHNGLTMEALARKTGLPVNGDLSRILHDLTDTGFIRVNTFFGKKKRDACYQLADYYTLFYFRFLKDNPGTDEHFWSAGTGTPARNAWAGFTFELLCMDHIRQIKKALDIAGVISEHSVWYTRGDDSRDGTQIDLLIDRRDRVINLCEIKFSTGAFEIDKAYDMRLRNMVNIFREATGTKKTLTVTMITTYGVKKNMYSSHVGREVCLEDLFEKV